MTAESGSPSADLFCDLTDPEHPKVGGPSRGICTGCGKPIRELASPSPIPCRNCGDSTPNPDCDACWREPWTGRDPELLLRFIDAVSPFVRDVLDEPFPWKTGGQVVVTMTRAEYEDALAALEALRD